MKSFFYLICVYFCFLQREVRGDKHHPVFPKVSPKASEEYNDTDRHYWLSLAQNELQIALNKELNFNVAKNVILFLGDGMSMPTVVATRIYDGQRRGERGEENFLSFDKFPHVGLSKTYNVDFQVPDSAGTATAFLTGSKTNKGVIGFDARVERGNCEDMTNETIVQSIAKWSQDKGKRTGVVTSTRITHATPSSLYAHSPDRDWECDQAIPNSAIRNCPFIKDIARQLVEDEPGNNFNVIMGGGFQLLDGNATDLPGDPVDNSCVRKDGRQLWNDWLDDKASQGISAAFVRTKTELSQVDLTQTEALMGIFANSHLPYEYEKVELGLDLPTLAEMTEAAITLLSQEPKGFFLLVEGGKIDHAHHAANAKISLDEAFYMNEAVEKALNLTNENETLIVVTADHAHTMSINGYPTRGNIITGTNGMGDDGLPYTTLSYANGPGHSYVAVDGEVVRDDIQNVDTSDFSYKQQGVVPTSSETHGGDDVVIYASGPMSHLFHSVHEQNYIPFAMAYASCVDADEKHCQSKRKCKQ